MGHNFVYGLRTLKSKKPKKSKNLKTFSKNLGFFQPWFTVCVVGIGGRRSSLPRWTNETRPPPTPASDEVTPCPWWRHTELPGGVPWRHVPNVNISCASTVVAQAKYSPGLRHNEIVKSSTNMSLCHGKEIKRKQCRSRFQVQLDEDGGGNSRVTLMETDGLLFHCEW